MRSIDEIRDYFRKAINLSLKCPKMFGPEIVYSHLISHLAFIENRDREYKKYFDSLKGRGIYNNNGVWGGICWAILMEPDNKEVASFYAEIAFQMGYLNVERVLSKEAFEKLRKGLAKKIKDRDWTLSEVIECFGIPSWGSQENYLWPFTFLYFNDQRPAKSIAFNFWQRPNFENEPQGIREKFGKLVQKEPILRSVRIPGRKDFYKEYTFTPKGNEIVLVEGEEFRKLHKDSIEKIKIDREEDG